MILKYLNYIKECENGLHESSFATRLVRLHNLKTRLHDAISELNNATVDFCVALDNESPSITDIKESAIDELLSNLEVLYQDIDNVYLMLDTYIVDQYFAAGINIEEKLNVGETVSKEEYDAFEKMNNYNPLAESPMVNASTLLSSKCYIDQFMSLCDEDSYSIFHELNSILFLIASEFKTHFSLNPSSPDQIYLKYKLMETDKNGLARTLYDPVEAQKMRRSTLSRDQRVLPENSNENEMI